MGDERFSALSRDPRYRLPNRKEARTAVDPRFGRLFTDQDFRKKASVDRYGRKAKVESGKKELERLYRLEKEKKPAKKVEREVVGSSDESEEESEDEGVVSKRDPAREGFSESESDEESTSDEEESDGEAELADATAGHEQTEDIPMGDVTQRIAAVNLDWDNIRAADLMKVASSFVPNSGRIEKVTIFPSEFGRERLEKEELEGPPREIFASSNRHDNDEDDEDDEDESEDEDEDERIKKQLIDQQANEEGSEFDTAKLRQYQLERLRYYYAVIECDSRPTAKALYDSMDGREYLSTANFFDLRFIPDDTSFEDDKPHETCTKLPAGYKPNDFRTEALTHSKVRLTWDDDDTTRKEVQKRAFSRAEVDENDLQAYIGSDDSDADSTTSRKSSAEDRKARKRDAERQRMRAALGLGEATAKSTKGGKTDAPVGDMQITFTSGLSHEHGGNGTGVFENEPQDEESTRQRYIRKEKERKQQRKNRMKGRTDATADSDDDDVVAGAAAPAEEEDAGFDDPFFTDPNAALAAEKKTAQKSAREAKRAALAAKDAETAARRKELELLMADEDGSGVKHFDMREIEKAEKDAKKKGKKGKKGRKEVQVEGEGDAGGDAFNVDVADPRFSKVMENHEFAIDPTNPRFKGTQGMKALLEEGRRKRKFVGEEEDGGETETKMKKGKRGGDGGGNGDELKGLVARLKGKGGKVKK